jgi:hypothetical protein
MHLPSLLARGYFPRELPTPFRTASFARLLTKDKSRPGHFAAKALKTKGFPKAKNTHYSHARGGLARRRLDICNPIHFFLLAQEITDHWTEIEKQYSPSPLSATLPVPSSRGRAVGTKHLLSNRVNLARQRRLGRHYILQSDISRFYPSIYTHSIPWALHTKPVAKDDHGPSFLGNRLDYLVRMSQD